MASLSERLRDRNRNNVDRLNDIFENVSGFADDIRANRLANLQEQKLRQELEAKKADQTPIAKVYGVADAELTPEAEAQTIAANKAKWEALRAKYQGVPTQGQVLEESTMQSPETFVSNREKFRQKYGVVPETSLSQFKDVQAANALSRRGQPVEGKEVWVNPQNINETSPSPVDGWWRVGTGSALSATASMQRQQSGQEFREGAENRTRRKADFDVILDAENSFEGYMDQLAKVSAGLQGGMESLASKSGQAFPDAAVADRMRNALAVTLYRAMTGDTRLSDADAASRAVPMIPTAYQNEAQRQKLANYIRTQIAQRKERISAGIGGGQRNAAPTNKPKTITQNGYTYTLNPATGQYE